MKYDYKFVVLKKVVAFEPRLVGDTEMRQNFIVVFLKCSL
jgi:hypothetical protein